MRTVGEFDVGAGEEVGFTLSWTPSFRADPAPLQAAETLATVEGFLGAVGGRVKPPAIGLTPCCVRC